MIASIIESYIKTYAGKYLKNFSSDKLVIGFNTVKLTDLEVSTEHLWRFRMPFRPVRAFVGEISVDLSFIFGGKLEISVKDVLFLFEKEEYESVINPQIIIDSLEALVSMLYFTIEYPFNTADSSGASQATAIDLEGIHRIIDRIVLHVENVHIRVEEFYSGVQTSSFGEDMMCLGLQFSKLSLRSPSAKEMMSHSEHFLNAGAHSKSQLIVNKVLNLEGLLCYCHRDNPLLDNEFCPITAKFVRSTMLQHQQRTKDILLQPTNVLIHASAAYHKGSFLLRPVKVHVFLDPIAMNITDEVVMYLYHLAEFFRDYPSRLQTLARTVLVKPVHPAVLADASYRARLRWDLLRRNIKADWWRWAAARSRGNIRWRAWFDTWRQIARYVALRELLLYHVGYEMFFDEASQSYHFALREDLKLYFASSSSAESRPESVGTGGCEPVYMHLAHFLVDQQVRSPQQVAALDFDAPVLRALYALQLEYDATLPYKFTAFGRRRAEEKYQRQVQKWRRQQEQNALRQKQGAKVQKQRQRQRAKALLRQAQQGSDRSDDAVDEDFDDSDEDDDEDEEDEEDDETKRLVKTLPSPCLQRLLPPSGSIVAADQSVMATSANSSLLDLSTSLATTVSPVHRLLRRAAACSARAYVFFSPIEVTHLVPSRFATANVSVLLSSRLQVSSPPAATSLAATASTNPSVNSTVPLAISLGNSAVLSNKISKLAYEAYAQKYLSTATSSSTTSSASNGTTSPPQTFVQSAHVFALPLHPLVSCLVQWYLHVHPWSVDGNTALDARSEGLIQQDLVQVWHEHVVPVCSVVLNVHDSIAATGNFFTSATPAASAASAVNKGPVLGCVTLALTTLHPQVQDMVVQLASQRVTWLMQHHRDATTNLPDLPTVESTSSALDFLDLRLVPPSAANMGTTVSKSVASLTSGEGELGVRLVTQVVTLPRPQHHQQQPASSNKIKGAGDSTSKKSASASTTTATANIADPTKSVANNVASGKSADEKAGHRVSSRSVATVEEVRAKLSEEVLGPMLKERRPILERALMANLSSAQQQQQQQEDDEDDEDNFILDPALVTLQDCKVQMQLPRFSFTFATIYMVPVQVRADTLLTHARSLPRTQVLPILHLHIEEVSYKMTAANNPISAAFEVVVGSISVRDVRPESLSLVPASSAASMSMASEAHHQDMDGGDVIATDRTIPSQSHNHSANSGHHEGSPSASLQRFSVTIPRCRWQWHIQQTSTMSRYLNGVLDRTCFDNTMQLSLLRDLIHIVVHGSAMDDLSDDKDADNNSGDGKYLLWRSTRPLAHLFLPSSHSWAQVPSNVSKSHFLRFHHHHHHAQRKPRSSSTNSATGSAPRTSHPDGDSEGTAVQEMFQHAQQRLHRQQQQQQEGHLYPDAHVVATVQPTSVHEGSQTRGTAPAPTAPSAPTSISTATIVSASTAGSVEASLLLGDWYDMHPRHLNVVKHLSAWVTHSATNTADDDHGSQKATSKTLTGKPTEAETDVVNLPRQTLTVRSRTAGRQLDCALQIAPPHLHLLSSLRGVHEHGHGSAVLPTVPMTGHPVTGQQHHGLAAATPVPLSTSSVSATTSSQALAPPAQKGGAPQWLGWLNLPNNNNNNNNNNNSSGSNVSQTTSQSHATAISTSQVATVVNPDVSKASASKGIAASDAFGTTGAKGVAGGVATGKESDRERQLQDLVAELQRENAALQQQVQTLLLRQQQQQQQQQETVASSASTTTKTSK